MTEGTVPVPPYLPALYDSSVLPVQVVSHFGGAEAVGSEPLMSVQVFFTFLQSRFPMKIVVFRFDAGIVTLLSISYDERRRPRRGAPAADR